MVVFFRSAVITPADKLSKAEPEYIIASAKEEFNLTKTKMKSASKRATGE
jgi:hypothetical protein